VNETIFNAWAVSFVDITGSIASDLVAKELQELRFLSHIYGASFNYGLRHALRLNMLSYASAFLQAIGFFSQIRLDYKVARDTYTKWSEIEKQRGHQEGEAESYHQLGIIEEKQRDFAAAESWYRKSLLINEKQGNEHGAASTYHQLGRIAEEQRDFVAAESWYRKSLEINEKQGNEYGAASTYHQLGRIAEEQRDFSTAESWYRKSLEIKKKQGNEHGSASTYHQLGMIAEKQRDFAAAESWYRKSLEIEERQGDEHGAAITYHQLGMIAEKQRDFAAAESWYRKALFIFEKLNNLHGAASVYHQLGIIAQEKLQLSIAKQWYQKALSLHQSLNDKYRSATTLYNLGILSNSQNNYNEAIFYFEESLKYIDKNFNSVNELYFNLLDSKLSILENNCIICENIFYKLRDLLILFETTIELNIKVNIKLFIFRTFNWLNIQKKHTIIIMNEEKNHKECVNSESRLSDVSEESSLNYLLGNLWHFLGNYKTDNTNDKLIKQSQVVMDAYEHAAKFFKIAYFEFDIKNPKIECLNAGLFLIKMKRRCGAWKESLTLLEEFYNVLRNEGLSKKIDYKIIQNLKALSFLESAKIMHLMGDYELAVDRFHDARRIFKKLENISKQVDCYVQLCIIYIQVGNIKEAKILINTALKLNAQDDDKNTRISKLQQILKLIEKGE